MARSKEIDVGGGAPVHGASGTTVKWDDGSMARLTLSESPEAAERGREIVERFRRAIEKEKLRDLARLLRDFPDYAARSPELLPSRRR